MKVKQNDLQENLQNSVYIRRNVIIIYIEVTIQNPIRKTVLESRLVFAKEDGRGCRTEETN